MKHFKFISLFLFTILCTLPAFAGGIPELDTVWTRGPIPTPADLKFAPDDSYILSMDGNGVLRFYKPTNGDTICSVYSEKEDVGFHIVKFSNNGKYLFASTDNRIYQFDAYSFKLIKTFDDVKDPYNANGFSISADDKLLAMVVSNRLQIWNIETADTVQKTYFPEVVDSIKQNGIYLFEVDFTKDGKYLIVRGSQGIDGGAINHEISWYGFTWGFNPNTFETLSGNLPHLGDAVSKDGTIALSYDSKKDSITVWSMPYNFICKFYYYILPNSMYFAFSKDNKYLIVNKDSGLMNIYDIYKNLLIANYKGNGYQTLDISKDDKFIITHVADYMFLIQTPWTNTSTQDQTVKDNILYPNPSTGNITLNINLNEDQDLSLIIIDENGSIKLNKNVGFINSGNQSIQINVNDLSNGAYICDVTGKSFSQTFKFQINK